MTKEQSYFQNMQYQQLRKSSIFVGFLVIALAVGIFLVIKNYKKWFVPPEGTAEKWQITVNVPPTFPPIIAPGTTGGTTTNTTDIQYFDSKNIYNYQNINDLYKELSKDGAIDARDAAILLHWSSTSGAASENDYCTQWNSFYNVVKDKDTNDNHKQFLEAVKMSYKNTFGVELYILANKMVAKKSKDCKFGFSTFSKQFLA